MMFRNVNQDEGREPPQLRGATWHSSPPSSHVHRSPFISNVRLRWAGGSGRRDSAVPAGRGEIGTVVPTCREAHPQPASGSSPEHLRESDGWHREVWSWPRGRSPEGPQACGSAARGPGTTRAGVGLLRSTARRLPGPHAPSARPQRPTSIFISRMTKHTAGDQERGHFQHWPAAL